MSDCRDLELLLASDEPDDRARAARHAFECEVCRPIYHAQERLAARVEALDLSAEPSTELESRVRTVVRRRLESLDAAPGSGRVRRGGGLRWAALAAALLTAVGLGLWVGFQPGVGPSAATDLLVVDALAEARRAEREHARAIASLEGLATARLARAEDPTVPAAEAARLLSYRDRLASLEMTIAEIQGYLRTNPAHPGARTVLLAAYRDKTDVLREILALGEPT